MKTILTVRGVSFELPNGRPLFTDVHFSLTHNRTALVGPNGVGKTVLANLLAGALQPTQGEILASSKPTLFPQREIAPIKSIAEYLLDAYAWSPLGEKLLEGIDYEALCTELSGGQWMRVRLAKHLDDSFLILDEPTNDLDRDGREALLQFLRERESGLLLISHDRECLQVCDDVLEISNRGFTKYGVSWDEYLSLRNEERESLQRSLQKAKQHRHAAELERTELTAKQEKRNRRGAKLAAKGGVPKILLGRRKRQAEASTGKIDAETLNRAQAAVQNIHEAILELKHDPIMYADLLGAPIPAQKLVAEALSYNVRFNKWLYQEDLSFCWRGNIRIVVRGKNGSGKSTLIKAILGEEYKVRGEIRRGELVTLYIDQRSAKLDDSKSIFENVREHSDYSESEIRNGLAKFLFTKDAVFQKVATLSGGERLRVALACGFLRTTKPELLVLDEPTNNLDLPNVEFLENLTREFKGALIVISHDETFLQNCEVSQELNLKSSDGIR